MIKNETGFLKAEVTILMSKETSSQRKHLTRQRRAFSNVKVSFCGEVGAPTSGAQNPTPAHVAPEKPRRGNKEQRGQQDASPDALWTQVTEGI